jgi:hypothetical protein
VGDTGGHFHLFLGNFLLLPMTRLVFPLNFHPSGLPDVARRCVYERGHVIVEGVGNLAVRPAPRLFNLPPS